MRKSRKMRKIPLIPMVCGYVKFLHLRKTRKKTTDEVVIPHPLFCFCLLCVVEYSLNENVI